jgi:hypothetical protein
MPTPGKEGPPGKTPSKAELEAALAPLLALYALLTGDELQEILGGATEEHGELILGASNDTAKLIFKKNGEGIEFTGGITVASMKAGGILDVEALALESYILPSASKAEEITKTQNDYEPGVTELILLEAAAPGAAHGAASLGQVITGAKATVNAWLLWKWLNHGSHPIILLNEKTEATATTTTGSKKIKLTAAQVLQLVVGETVTASLGGLAAGTNTIAAIISATEIELNQAVAVGHALNVLTFTSPSEPEHRFFFKSGVNLELPVNEKLELLQDPEIERLRLSAAPTG